MKTYVATTNPGKLAELRAMLSGSPLELTLFPAYAAPAEDANDYEGNASLKVAALRAQLGSLAKGAAILADDSGLEVAALGGRPGVRSARRRAASSRSRPYG